MANPIDKLYEDYIKLNDTNSNALKIITDGSQPGLDLKRVEIDLRIGCKRKGPRIQEVSLITAALERLEWNSMIELGVGYGISTISFANTLKNRIDKNVAVFQTVDFAECSNIDKKITLARQENIKKLQESIELKNWLHTDVGIEKWFKEQKIETCQKFNVAFIDGDHSYKSTRRDWNCIEKLLKEDFIVFFHDLTHRTQGLTYPKTARRAFEEISIEKYTKLILNTPYRLGVVYPKNNEDTEKWLSKTLKSLDIAVKEIDPMQAPANKCW